MANRRQAESAIPVASPASARQDEAVPDDDVLVPRSGLLAVRRLLWDAGSADTTKHDQKVECFHWGAVFDQLAGMPPWPTGDDSTAQVVAFYEPVRDHLDAVLTTLRTGTGE